ncbi:MAG: class I SAM-dependent methyltransferase [Acidimicrobiia bacterium]
MSSDMIRMNDALFDYMRSVSMRDRPILADHRAETAKNPRATMAVSPLQGQFMEMLVQALRPMRIVEVGVFTGYSSLVMAMASPTDAHLWCFDLNQEWTAVAQDFWERASVDHKVTLRHGPAVESLEALLAEGHRGTMDLVFIDADKGNYWQYWNLGLELLRDGGLLIADNTLFQGFVDPDVTESEVRARFAGRPPAVIDGIVQSTLDIRWFNELVANDDRVTLSMVPVGDGMTFGVKRAEQPSRSDLDDLAGAYRAFFAAAGAADGAEVGTVIDGNGFVDPPAGEWSAAQVIAHIALNDAGLIAVSRALLHGEVTMFDNAAATDVARLDALAAGRSIDELVQLGRARSEQLLHVLGRLDDEQLDTAVPCRLLDGGRIGFEGSMPWRQLVLQIHPNVHLTGHTAQLSALRR